MTGTAFLTSGSCRNCLSSCSALSMDFPLTGETLIGGSMSDVRDMAKSLKPLNTDNTQTVAIVATATPARDIKEITLTAP